MKIKLSHLFKILIHREDKYWYTPNSSNFESLISHYVMMWYGKSIIF